MAIICFHLNQRLKILHLNTNFQIVVKCQFWYYIIKYIICFPMRQYLKNFISPENMTCEMSFVKAARKMNIDKFLLQLANFFKEWSQQCYIVTTSHWSASYGAVPRNMLTDARDMATMIWSIESKPWTTQVLWWCAAWNSRNSFVCHVLTYMYRLYLDSYIVTISSLTRPGFILYEPRGTCFRAFIVTNLCCV